MTAPAARRMERLGVIADDFTGACDLAGQVAAAGVPATVVTQLGDHRLPPEVGCVVVALKSRTSPVEQAVAETHAAARWLLERGASVLYQKYCSTFDSTPAGNIGPVADALMDVAAAEASIGTPASPSIDRTVYQGHLFVGDRLLSESSLRDHPLTPMDDPDLVRVLTRQTPRRVAHVARPAASADDDRLERLTSGIDRALAGGARHVLLDAVDEADLDLVAAALERVATDRKVTLAGAAGLAVAWARRQPPAAAPPLPLVSAGRRLILAGSCSQRTVVQIAHHRGPHLRIDVRSACLAPDAEVQRALTWLASLDPAATPLVSSSATPEQVRAWQGEFGRERVAAALEGCFAEIAAAAVDGLEVRRLLVAGGETSGAVAQALGVTVMHLADQVSPGLAWVVAERDRSDAVALLLKSGNFGSPDLFATAWAHAPSGAPD